MKEKYCPIILPCKNSMFGRCYVRPAQALEPVVIKGVTRFIKRKDCPLDSQTETKRMHP